MNKPDDKTKQSRPPQGKSQAAMLKKMTKQTYAIIGICIILLLTFAGLTIYSSSCKDEQIENTIYLNQYRIGSKNLTYAVQSYAVSGDNAYYDNYEKELNEDKNRDIAWEGLKNNNLEADEWEELEHIASLSDGLVPLEEEALEAVKNNDRSAAVDLVFGDSYEDTVTEISASTDECITKIQTRMASRQSLLNTLMIISMICFGIACIFIIAQIQRMIQFSQKELLTPIVKVSDMIKTLAQGIFTMENDMQEDESEVGTMVASINFMNQNFTNMIAEISKVLGSMSKGDYTLQPQQQYVGDFVEIKDSMIKISDATKQIITTIHNVASEIDGGSEQLATAAADLADGCTVQASKISEISETIDELSNVMKEKMTDAQETVTLSNHTEELVIESNTKMQELKTAIDEINSCSEEIHSIIITIEDIANQTNLLSLNASIEAARAGEAGKGFAVVAGQVKELAERSTQAVGETTVLIQKTIEAVEKGMSLSDMAVENMNAVMTNAKSSNDKLSLLAKTMKEESDSMKEINDSVIKVAEIVDNNSASSEETAAVSEEQSAQVQLMVQMLEKFKI